MAAGSHNITITVYGPGAAPWEKLPAIREAVEKVVKDSNSDVTVNANETPAPRPAT